jgi:hypothetical protein
MATLPFNMYGHNIHSQNGEDGIISELLNRLNLKNPSDRWCVEFGAWDGIHLSNTFALVEGGWKAVYIEGQESRFQALIKTTKKYPNIFPIRAFVSRYSNEENSLDRLLADTSVPKSFDLLSIDIDSYDSDVWESLVNYFPKIVVIEINSLVPPGIYWRHGVRTAGNTFSETLKVGIKKGYTLVCHTGNLIFVKNELMYHLDFPTKFVKNPELLFLDRWIFPDSYSMYKKLKTKSLIISLVPQPILLMLKKLKLILLKP